MRRGGEVRKRQFRDTSAIHGVLRCLTSKKIRGLVSPAMLPETQTLEHAVSRLPLRLKVSLSLSRIRIHRLAFSSSSQSQGPLQRAPRPTLHLNT